MQKKTTELLISLAMEEAQIAADEGNYPFGAVLADLDGNVLFRAHNTQVTDRDPTAHAEINLIRHAARKRTSEELSRCILICNAESCSMCMSASIKAGIKHYVFGAPSELHMEPYLTVPELVKFCRSPLDITYGVRAEACRRQIQRFRQSQGKLAQ